MKKSYPAPDFKPRHIEIQRTVWNGLARLGKQCGKSVPQLVALALNGATRGLVDFEHIESVLVDEGWWKKDFREAAKAKTRKPRFNP